MAAPAAKTRQDLAKQAFIELRVIRVDASPTAEQKAQADSKYDGLYAELGIHGLAYWPDQDAIPVEAFNAVSMLVAQELAPAFGKQYSAGDAMARLRIVAAKPWSGKTPPTKYF